MIGSVIDKYEVLQKLGEGATATVYRGRHIAIGKDVAIKVLHPHLSASSRNRERFNREARAVGRLSHQNIVSILDYSGPQAADCYIVTELVDGVTALQLLQDHGNLPSEIATLIGIDLCAALGFAHVEGVIHRDIKPENVMIRRDGTVKLMDFGVARVLDEGSITIDGSLLGSPAYMSPQQALDQPLDGRSDLFSLGTVLFQLVTGHVPFAGSNASVILRNIIDGARPEVLELAPMASPSLAAAIDRLLQLKPEDRFPTAAAAETALRASLAEVDLAPDHPTINLRTFLGNPEPTLASLDEHLHRVLLQKGKERLTAKDHLGALQLFNRLLAIDEENAEVLALIQALHQSPTDRSARRWLAPVAAALLVGLSGAAWWVSRTPAPSPPPVVDRAAADGSVGTLTAAPPTVSVAAPSPSPEVLIARPSTVTSGAAASVLRAPGPSAASVTAPSPAAPTPPSSVAPGRITWTPKARWGEVWLDGKRVGTWGDGARSSWVGSKDNPLEVGPGSHTVRMVNQFSEPRDLPITVEAGQALDLGSIELRLLPVHFTVNPNMPRDCSYEVRHTREGGKTSYGLVAASANFEIREPDPADEVVFSCPTLGELRHPIGPTEPGQGRVIPTSMAAP